MKKTEQTIPKFDTQRSMRRATSRRRLRKEWRLKVSDEEFIWSNKMELVDIIRKGLPYESIEVVSKRADLPVKQFLTLFDLPQTTYNKKKREKDLLSGRDSEIVLLLTELLDFGVDVFNNEIEKFQRWLKKPNLSLGGVAPKTLFDSLTGIQQVENSLNRLEYGNMA